MSFAEVPLLYPSHQSQERRRFVIHDEEGSIERVTASNINATADASSRLRLPGSSSASSLADDVVVTTCALVNEPTVLSVSLVQGTASPIMVDLDLGQTKVFGIPVKIQCFPAQGSALLLLRLVDTRGIVLSITLDSSSLTPDALQLLSVPHLVESQLSYDSGAELDSSMVTFLSSAVLVMGLAPNLLAVNIDSGAIDVWSQAQTLEEMKSKSLGHIFSRASDLFFLGRPEDEDDVDMPPAAAICQAGGQYVFSLHSDASIRRWRVDELHPTEVVLLKVAQDAIPAPEQWSDSPGTVALCAQLYSSVYALAIHVQTFGGDENKSPCQMIVVHGSQDEAEGGDLVKSAVPLIVPKAATSLVGLDLASERCRLTALFQSQENDANNTLFVTYPPSIVSIVSNEPIVTPHENTLDGVAAYERARLTRLSFPVNGASLEEDLHAVDTAFLKYLFRPAFSRGIGVVTPPSCVRAAIRKLVPGHFVSSGEDMSIELETLRAMHEWRRLDSRNISSPGARQPESIVANTPGGSVYDSYARQDPDGTPEMDMDDSYMVDEKDLMDQERAAQVESQQQRWRELLLAVWNEEERMRDPLCVSNILSKETSSFVLVRAGVTSLLKEVDTMEDATSTWQDLDRSALILLGRVENDEQELAKSISTETLLFEEIAKASLALSTGDLGEYETKISGVGSRALAETDNDEINRDGVALALREASQEDMLDWLQSIESLFSLGLPGASVLPDSADVLDDESGVTWTNRIADAQTRLAASGLFVQCTDSVRRLALARLLLLSSFSNEASSSEDPIFRAAFRQYLYSVSVLWTCAQQVPMPSAGLFGRNRNVEFGEQTRGSSPSDSPPLKRVNLGETTSSILAGGGGNATTALDARLIQISQAHSQSLYETSLPDGPITTMVRICVNSTFAAALSSTLPELGVLPTPSDESVASDYPRLALRLIAPFYAEPPLNEDEDMLLARKEALAECLLIEANAESQKGPSSEPLVISLQKKACDLLSPSSSDSSPSDSVKHNLLETVFMTLSKQSQVMVEPDLEEIERSERALADELKLLLTGTQGRPGTEITRLCQQPTVMAVFLPLMATERKSFFRSLEELSRASVKSMVEVLLRISKLMHRLSILERHTGSVGGLTRGVSSGKNDFLLGYIEETISEFQTLLPRSVYNSMTEYASLWTLLFNHSVSARRWKTAHLVCVNHPVQERRVENYKRFVIAMVNAGSLSELIDLCTMVVAGGERTDSLEDGGACIDFYEIAAETLAAARQGDPYEHGSISTDFLGCLYAIHAARVHWERAAQAMDEKYTAALKALSSSMNQGSRLASVVNVNAAANDLVLASLFSSNAVQSIEDPSKRFLVGGEVGPFPSLPDTSASETDVVEVFGVKRGRSEQGWTTPRRADHVEREGTDEDTRLSRFMTVVDLNARAARAVALWIFLHDKKVDRTNVSLSSIESPSVEGDRACIDRLASLGYYEQAILVAKAIDAQCEERTCGAYPGGRSLLQDSILQVLTYVLPVAFRQTNRPSSDEMETDEERHRPTLSQLRRAIEEAGGMSKDSFSFVLGETWWPMQDLPAVARASAAMELIRKLTTECSTASSPIALEVACMFLDIDPSGASVPLWLERLLVGRNDPGEDSSGLFAHMATASGGFSGDPAGLVSLYMKRGLYVKACDIVSSAILTGTLSNESASKLRETQAPSRLPEKGDIDFVPYAKIDVLWTSIDRALASPVMDTTERKKLEESRMTMERALEKHFELMKISEQGLRSARALTQ